MNIRKFQTNKLNLKEFSEYQNFQINLYDKNIIIYFIRGFLKTLPTYFLNSLKKLPHFSHPHNSKCKILKIRLKDKLSKMFGILDWIPYHLILNSIICSFFSLNYEFLKRNIDYFVLHFILVLNHTINSCWILGINWILVLNILGVHFF